MKLCSIVILIFFMCSLALATSAGDSILIVKDISIRGNKSTKDNVILREMSLHIGDTLTEAALDRDQNQIYNLGLFNRVDLSYSTQRQNVYITVIVVERWFFIPFPIVGFKYRDLSKLYYGAGITHQNFRGRNEKLGVNFGLGYDRWFSFNYGAPKITSDDDISLGFLLTLQKIKNLSESYGEYENTNIYTRFSIGKRLGLYHTFAATVGYDVWQVTDPGVGRTLSSDGRDAFPMSALEYRFDHRNDREYTTDGTLIDIVFAKFGLGSIVNTGYMSYDARRFFGFGEGCGIGFRTNGAFTTGGLIPPYGRVFFGYDDRIRGYFNTIIEGENKIAGAVELRLPILLPRYLSLHSLEMPEFTQLRYGIYFGIFANAGKIWYRNQIVADQPWYSGYGAGFHFLLPYAFCLRIEGAMNNYGKTELYLDLDVSF